MLQYQKNQILPLWMDNRLEKRKSLLLGHGIFTKELIMAGEELIHWGGEIIRLEDIKSGKYNPKSMARISDEFFLGDPVSEEVPDDYYVNHCCDSNLWLKDSIIVVARRDIQVDEELTIDYALWEYMPDFILQPCLCGSDLCRGKVTGGDWKNISLQKRYAGHFSEYLNYKIKNL